MYACIRWTKYWAPSDSETRRKTQREYRRGTPTGCDLALKNGLCLFCSNETQNKSVKQIKNSK